MLSPPPPWVSTYRTRRLSAVCVIGWGSPCTATPTPVQNAVPQLILFGDHQVGCGGNGDRISRHNAVRDVIFAAAQSAALGPSKEVLGLVPAPSLVLQTFFCLTGTSVAQLPWMSTSPAPSRSRPLLRLPSPLGMPSKLVFNGNWPLTSLHAALLGTDFIPLVAETFGGLAEDTVSTVSAIARAISDRSHATDPATTSRHLFGRLAIALWSGNAGLWLHRHPTLPPFLDGVV